MSRLVFGVDWSLFYSSRNADSEDFVAGRSQWLPWLLAEMMQPKTSGNYTFFTQADDGVRLWVNGRQPINDWEDRRV